MTSRRDFLKASGLIALGAGAPAVLSRAARAAGRADEAGKRETVLVVVQLSGGNDGLNTVIPYTDPNYARLRPTIKVPVNQVKKIDDSVGLHPALDGLAKLLEKQALGIVQGVGYPNPSQSHFRSMDIWHAGSTAETLTEGWIGKALKSVTAPAFHLAGANEIAPLAVAGAPTRVPSLASIEEFALKFAASDRADKQAQRQLIEGAAKAGDGNGLLGFVQTTASNTYASSKRLTELGKAYQPKVPYPTSALANRLKIAAQLIDADLGARVFYVSTDGFDTHASQGGAAGPHANLLRDVGDAIAAFYGDMAARGHGDRLLVMTFSEFGRRAKENGSRGTDHGSAAPVLLVGGKVQPGLIGSHPSLETLEFGNLKHAIDFRQVYASVLDRWLGVNSEQVLGAKYEATPLFKA